MAAGETLLKITDFPFAYSFIAIVLGTLNVDIRNENFVIFISAAGAFGTFLTITDPLGRLLKFWMGKDIDRIIKMPVYDSNSVIKLKSAKQAIETRAIGIEIDKFVSLGYFVIILLMYNTLLVYSESFVDNLILKDKMGKTICDTTCIRNDGDVISFIAVLIVVIVGVKNWKKLKKHVVTAGVHQTGISSEDVTRPTIENITRAIEQNDWTTAEKWADVVEKEIQSQKGRKDAIAQMAQTVNEPLYMEALQIEATCNSITQNKFYQGFSIERWRTIKSGKGYLMMDDDKFRSRLDVFYNLIEEYHRLLNSSSRSSKRIIQNRCSESYGKNINEIYFRIETIQGIYSADVVNLITYGASPTESTREDLKPKVTQAEIRKTDGTTKVIDSVNDMDQFNKIFQFMLDDASKDEEIKGLRKTFQKINSSVIELKKQLTEKIKAQW